MRLERLLPEQRRLHRVPGSNKLLVIGVVLAIHLVLAAGWTAWSALHEPEEPTRYVIRYFDIASFPTPEAAAAIVGDTAASAASNPAPGPYRLPPPRDE